MKKTLLTLLVLCASVLTAGAQNTYKIHKYTPNDGGILVKITPNGKWGLITLGTSAGGGSAEPKLYNMETEEITPIAYNGRAISANDISDDASVIVGSMSGRAVAYNRTTNKITVFPTRQLWQSASLTAVTPDGKYAVGHYNGYNGKLNENDDLSHDYYYSTLFVNCETGDTIATPGLPKVDRTGTDQHAIKFDNITPDGRYILGQMSWYIMQPNSLVTFIYDTQEHTYRVVGFDVSSRNVYTPLYEGMNHIETPMMSPDGHWLTGMAYIAKSVSGSEFFNEYGVPFRYDIQTGKFEVIDNTELNIETCVINNNGTIFGNPNAGGPLRDFRVLYNDKYWITLNQICKQQYGFNYKTKTGFDRTGTVVSVSADGSRIISFVDPLGESYCFDFGQSIESVCDNIDLLDNYTATPVDGSVFSVLSTIEINFGRPVHVLGKGNTHVHLYKEDGTKVADALSTASGLALKTGSSTTVTAVFRTRQLENGVKYYVQIDEGAVCVGNDESRVNKQIRLNYGGRSNAPVALTKAVPEDHSQLRQIDAATSYILLTFDCPVQLTDEYSAYIERAADHNRVATLTVNIGNTESTKNQVLLYPSSELFLYQGEEYKVVFEAGSVSDYSGSETSYNQQIELTYHGTYVREVSNDEVIFADSWDNISESLQTWLRYDGDHNTPLASMQAFEFDADNQPWNFSIRESNNNPDYCAASHSLYSPSGRSDDWMMTPQLLMPKDGKAVLEFDAQNYRASKNDTLKVYIFEEEFAISYLNAAWMEDIRERAELLDAIALSPGADENLLADDWTHYSYSLSKWADKNIYIAFVNQNYNQSMIFVDNVRVQRELLYTVGFSNADRVVAQDEISIAGKFTVKAADGAKDILLILKDSNGNAVSQYEWHFDQSVKDKSLDFAFDKPLPLTIGSENNYTIEVTLGDRTDIMKGTIYNLAFQPVKRVVLEEMTGIDCPNCPLGILTIEKLEKAFGDQFIPVSIHTFTGDPYAGTMGAYSSFLGLNAAPSARINRIPGIYYPMVSGNGVYLDTYPEDPLWIDVVTQELNRLSIADITLQAVRSADGKKLDIQTDLKYAIDATDQQLSLLVVILENGLVNYQANNLGSLSFDILGDWGANGSRSGTYAYPVTHNDVARSVIGQTMSGTIGLFPSSLKSGTVYSANFSASFPESISETSNATAVAMLIDTQSGEVINAAKANVTDSDQTGILSTDSASDPVSVFTPSGVLIRSNATQTDINSLPRGLYIIGNKKVIVK